MPMGTVLRANPPSTRDRAHPALYPTLGGSGVIVQRHYQGRTMVFQAGYKPSKLWCRLIALLVAGFLLPTFAVGAHDYGAKRLSTEERMTCLADHGRVAAVSLGGDEGCIRPMPDAGKSCTDGSQCLGHTCSASPVKSPKRPIMIGQRATGICVKESYDFSCGYSVVKGRLQIRACQ